MNEIKSKTLLNGHKVVVSYDHDPESPREWDNLGTVVISNRSRYGFGDETASPEDIKSLESDKSLICLPIYIYDHSGITINTTGFTCRWDSGQVGVIYCTKAAAVKEFGKKICTANVREKALKALQAEVGALDAYLQGEVYGYRVFNPEGEEVTSCWGYYGDADFCLQEGENFVKDCCSSYLSVSDEDRELATLELDHCCGEGVLRSVR